MTQRPPAVAALTAVLAVALGTLISLAGPAQAAQAGPARAAGDSSDSAEPAEVYVVQGVVGEAPDIWVDGEKVRSGVEASTVVGPLEVEPGAHEVQLRDGGKTLARKRFDVRAGQSTDVVGHLRSGGGKDVALTAYRNDLADVGPGKVRLSVAHTAAAPPADIRLDGDILFSNVANGETLTLVVPAGTYKVDIVPAATTGTPVLGPVDLSLRKGTLARVFAIGDVSEGSLEAVVHTLTIGSAGAPPPKYIPTGDGGQAALDVVGDGFTASVMGAGAAGLLLAAAATTGIGRRRRRAAR